MQTRNLLWLLPLSLLLSVPLWWQPLGGFLKPRGGYDPAALERAMQMGRYFHLDKIVISLANEGEPSWEIRSQEAQTEPGNDRLIHMTTVRAVFHGKDGSDVFIESRRGSYHLDTRLLALREQVVLRKPSSSQVLRTELLYYDDANKMINSPVQVEIEAPDYHITGGRLDYDVATDAYDLGKRVHCRF